MGILSTSVSGLLTTQRALATTAHNIANVNTPGYSRQTIEVKVREPQFTGAGFLGKGVEVGSIRRIHSEFLTDQLRVSTSSSTENATFFNLASRVDNIVADEGTGLSPSLLSFFNSVQDVADIPSSISARQVMVSEAEALVARFQFLDSRLDDLTSEIRIRLGNELRDINSLSQSLADINGRIVEAFGDIVTEPPNDLLDQRDELVRQLAEIVSVSTSEQDDGSLNVFIGQGQSLVLGGDVQTLSYSETYQGHYEIILTGSFSSSTVTDNITGGNMGGLLRFQSEMLEPARNSLGRLAIGLADSFNDQHILGMSLDGDVNQTFFNVATPDVSPLSGAPNNVTAAIVDPAALTESNYSLIFNGANSYTLTRLIDGQTTAINTGAVSPYTTATIDGFTTTITAGAAIGDEYIIRPATFGARDIATVISDPRKIAAAAPLRSGEAVDANGLPNNTGTGAIGEVSISSVTGIPLGSSITLTFDAILNQFNISAPPGGTLAYNPATDSNGVQFTIAAAGNASFTLSGVPDDGDQFVIQNNTNADGDNRNALDLAALQSSKLMLNGTASYQDTYGKLVADVGTTTRQSEISQQALSALLTQATELRESLSGVNLDEEAAEMLILQQAYQAAAQMISTSDRLFQSLIDSI